MKKICRCIAGIVGACVNCLMVFSLSAQNPGLVKPVQRPILLSGNFGELRATHFHSGIDIRTGGVEGLPVVCIKDGILVRVRVSPVGYGQALYVEHEDGTTSVYGHLREFAPEVQRLVRKLQYTKESFEIDEDIRNRQLRFYQGDTIAYSGNTGSSGGPHLHFELRNTQTEHTLNPLLYYKVRDHIAPKVRAMYLYRISEDGYVERFKRMTVKPVAKDRYRFGNVSVPAGKIGLAVFAEDYMNDSWNKLGIYRIRLYAGENKLFQWQVDSCSFDQTAYCNEMKDFDRYKVRETVYRCFGFHHEKVLGVEIRNQGVIELQQDSCVQIKMILEDVYENRTEVTLALKGIKPHQDNVSSILRYDYAGFINLSSCRLDITKGSLYSSIKKQMREKTDTLTGKKMFIFSDSEVPLLKKARLYIYGNFSGKTVICELGRNGEKFPLRTLVDSGGVYAYIGCLSRYTVEEDEEAPTVTYLGISGQQLKFKVQDKLSGIAYYRGKVNGRWCLFTYDPKKHLLWCDLKEPVFKEGINNQVKLCVKDQVGNTREIEINVKK